MLIAKNIKGFEVYTSCADMHGKRQSSTFGGLFLFYGVCGEMLDLLDCGSAGSSPVIPTTRGYNLRVKQGPPEPLMWVQFPPSTYTCSLKGFTNNM